MTRLGYASVRLNLATFVVLMMTQAICAAEKSELLHTFRNEFVPIRPGEGKFPATFWMGREKGLASEAPAHQVTLAAFQIAKYEVPQNLWEAVMGENPSKWKGPRNSVEMLNFDDAQRFCRKVTTLLREAELIKANEVVRLPSEAEWEYACRAGTPTAFSFGDDASQLGEYGWFTGNAAGNDPPVGAKKPNSWGLYDMHGYLWEWCSDPWHDDYQGAPGDGLPWVKGGDDKRRVLRSGSWKDPAEQLSSSFRRAGGVDLKDDAVGLRCVLSSE